MVYNQKGLKYFIYNITKNNKYYLEIPLEIRMLIWKYAHCYPYVQCYICDKIVLNLNIDMEIINSTENYSIKSGILECNNC